MCLVYRQRRSVAVADVPDLELSHVLGFDALTDTLTAGSLATQLVHVGLHCPLAGRVVGGSLVNQESAVVLFDHGSSIRGQQWEMGQTADTWSGVTVIHAMGSPLRGHFQITMGSPYFANHTEQRRWA